MPKPTTHQSPSRLAQHRSVIYDYPMMHHAVRLWLRRSLLLCLLLGLASGTTGHKDAHAQSVRIANHSYSQEQVYKIIGRLNAATGAPQQHSSAVNHQGYIVQVYAEENDRPRAGIAVFDLSDPTNPTLVARTEENADKLSEQHMISFTHWQGRDYVALLAVDGIEIWDWTDIQAIQQVGRLELPGVAVGYSRGAWWSAWQAPYLYVSGASNGVFIIDTSDPAQPRLINRGGEPNPIPNNQTGGFRTGPIFAVGNLLVLSANDGRGYATLDIGDPANPKLLDSLLRDSEPSYSSMLNGNRIYSAGTDDDLHALDISDPSNLRELDDVDMGGHGGYLTLQDGFAHVGASSHYVKVDVRDEEEFRVVGTASSNLPEHDEDFAVVVGNLVILSDDHYNGSFIFPHQAEPDTTGPVVNMVSPPDRTANQPRTSRIGVTFSDRIDLRTVNPDTFIVRPVGGDPISGAYSTQTGIVNFTPDRPLAADTTYEVIIPAGGIRDAVGNPVPTTFDATFSTGTELGESFWCEIQPPQPVTVGENLLAQVEVAEARGGYAVRWQFGDDSATIDSGSNRQAQHRYDTPGHYTIRALVTDALRTTTCAVLATVHPRPAAGQPRSNSTIILDQSGTQVWNVNPDNNSVAVIDAVRLEKMAEIPVGRNPRSLAQAPDDTIWVVNQDDATISVISVDSRTVIATIPLPPGSDPYAIVFSPQRSEAYVSLQSLGRLAAVDLGSRQMRAQLDVGPTPRALALDPTGNRLYITRWISPADHGEVVAVDPNGWRVEQRIELAFDPGPDTEASGRGVPNGLAALSVAPDGGHLWVAGRKDNTARGQQRDGLRLTFESTVRSMLAQIDLTRNAEQLDQRYDFNNRDGPVALAFSPLGDYLFVALEGANAIDIIDAYSGQLVGAIENAGVAPQGLVFTADGSKLFVHSWLSREVRVFDMRDFLAGRSRQAQPLATLRTIATETLPPDVLQGKQIFYNAKDPRMGRDGYLACASCHFDSRDDGRIWDRTAEGEGLRNTQTLLGKGRPGNGLIHWSGNFDEVQDFEHDMRDAFGGIGFLADADFAVGTRNQPLGDPKAGLSTELDALAAYVNSLREVPRSPFRAADGGLTEEGAAGRAVFIAAGCTACHGGAEFTDSPLQVRHQVGTITAASGQRLGHELAGLDTPTLRGLWLTPPYLHDGSAATLYDVLTSRNTVGMHGDLPDIVATNPQAISQLVAYLLQIDDREPGFPMPSPAVELASPKPGTRLKLGRAVRLSANTANLLGKVAQVEFYAGDQRLGSDDQVLYDLEWTPTTSGPVALTARLVYESGASTISAPVPIEVVP